MEGLSIENILGQEDIENLFSDETEIETTQETSPEQKEETTTEEVNPEELFEETPESVSSEENQEKEDTISEKETGSSPTNNFYSSIAKALQEDGVFPDLDDETISGIKEPEDLAKAIESQIKAGLDERQRRIDEALDMGVEPDLVKQYENTIAYLDSITDEKLSAEDDEGENLRKQLIYQDLLNKKYSKEEAREELEEIFASGNDLKKAKRALAANKEFFKDGYQSVVEEAREATKKEAQEREQQAAALKKSILEDKEVFKDLQIDKTTRQKIFDNISKPIYKDKETGEYFTAIQKYERENKVEFLKNLGLLFTLTDGFKNLDGLVKPQVKKEVKKGLRELEHTLNNTARTSGGNIKFVSGVSEDPEAFFNGKWDLDV